MVISEEETACWGTAALVASSCQLLAGCFAEEEDWRSTSDSKQTARQAAELLGKAGVLRVYLNVEHSTPSCLLHVRSPKYTATTAGVMGCDGSPSVSSAVCIAVALL